MYQAIVESLPIAFGIIIATLPGLAIPLILLTRREIAVLRAFMAGYAVGFIVLGGVVILVADVLAPNPDGPAAWIVWLRILLGAALLGLAWRKWQSRAVPGDATELPGWMKSIDTITATSAALLGFALVVLNPKNAVLVASGALAIAFATQAPLAQIGALVVFTVVSGIGVATPWIMWLVMGERAVGPLDRLKSLLARNNTLIMTAVLAVLGLVVIANALNYL